MKKNIWIEFNVYKTDVSDIKAKYRIVDNDIEVKLITKVNKGWYYSCLNDAISKAKELSSII
ncbi:MAG: hypothetical protein RLZZ546_1068 [Bacteroidota bacterium]|jgi:hypothetical protein